MVKELLVGGFSGELAAVNPKYDDVEGVACYPRSGRCLSPRPGVAGGGQPRLEEQMDAAADRGARGVVVFASGLEDPPRDPPLTERLS